MKVGRKQGQVSPKTAENLKKLFLILNEDDISIKNATIRLGITEKQFYKLLIVATFRYPIFEYECKGRTFLGLLNDY